MPFLILWLFLGLWVPAPLWAQNAAPGAFLEFDASVPAYDLSSSQDEEEGRYSWGGEVEDWAREYEDHREETQAFEDPYVFSGWGVLRAAHRFYWGAGFRFAKKWDVGSPHKLRVLFRRQKKKAPLIVVSPGIFGSAQDVVALRALRNFYRRGYHVLLVPNPWSRDYLAAETPHLPGELIAEARLLLDLTHRAVQELGSERVSWVEMVGESYGGALSLIAGVLDAQSEHPVIDGAITALSPPWSFHESLHRMDEALDRYQDDFVNLCRRYTFKSLNDVFWAKDQEDLSPLTVRCGPSLIVYIAFQGQLLGVANTLLKQGRLPHPEQLKRQLKDPVQQVALRFESFLQNYLPRTDFLLKSGEGDMLTWLERARVLGLHRSRVLSAEDDFLNDPHAWEQWREGHLSHRLLLLPWGSHLGYLGLKGFQKFFHLGFPLNN